LKEAGASDETKFTKTSSPPMSHLGSDCHKQWLCCLKILTKPSFTHHIPNSTQTYLTLKAHQKAQRNFIQARFTDMFQIKRTHGISSSQRLQFLTPNDTSNDLLAPVVLASSEKDLICSISLEVLNANNENRNCFVSKDSFELCWGVVFEDK
jgi:hypothetical protein